jgi:hypothetical protein
MVLPIVVSMMRRIAPSRTMFRTSERAIDPILCSATKNNRLF